MDSWGFEAKRDLGGCLERGGRPCRQGPLAYRPVKDWLGLARVTEHKFFHKVQMQKSPL